jgi:(S)-2-hydroxy-acid oxidase
LAFTVDSSVWGKRDADEKFKFSLPAGIQMEVYKDYLGKDSNVQGKNKSALTEFVNNFKDNSFTFERIKEIRAMTKLPIILKGIQCAEDAARAVEVGVDAIWVSNHGARQLDTTPASIEVLEECVAAVKGKIEVYFDGGVS